jgi:hypothetical protein
MSNPTYSRSSYFLRTFRRVRKVFWPSSPELIFCNSMAKSGSSVLAWYVEQMLFMAHERNGQAEFREQLIQGKISGRNMFVKDFSEKTLQNLRALARRHGPVAVKMHEPFREDLLELMECGKARMVFSHRDPRDMILSAMDHRHRAAGKGEKVFQEFRSVEHALPEVKWWCELACAWNESGLACVVKYVDLVQDPLFELCRISQYLGFNFSASRLQRLIAWEAEVRRYGVNQFNQGAVTRFASEMSAADQELCRRELGPYLDRLGYERQPTLSAERLGKRKNASSGLTAQSVPEGPFTVLPS